MSTYRVFIAVEVISLLRACPRRERCRAATWNPKLLQGYARSRFTGASSFARTGFKCT